MRQYQICPMCKCTLDRDERCDCDQSGSRPETPYTKAIVQRNLEVLQQAYLEFDYS